MDDPITHLPVSTRWKKGEHGTGRGRIAGFTHYAATLFAQLMETCVDEDGIPVYDEDGNPDSRQGMLWPIRVLQRYMKAAVSGDARVMENAVDRILPYLEKIDDILANQRNKDIKFMRYLVFLWCFDEQQSVLWSKKPMILVICGRRAGKSHLDAALLVDRGLSHDKGWALYIGRTSKSAMDMIWKPLTQLLKDTGIPHTIHVASQSIELANGVQIGVRGRATKEDVENIRGLPVFLAIIDETQSDPPEKLRMLVREVLEPAGSDFEDSQRVLSGTPSRIPGNYAEELYQGNDASIARFNWNMSVNPHIPAAQRDLEKVRKIKGFWPQDPTWQREYLGVVGAYDTDAQVFRYAEANHYTIAQLITWIDTQPVTDLFLAGGIDYGFDDWNSAVIILASVSQRERFLLGEYKGHRQSTEDFGNNIKRIMQTVLTMPCIVKLPGDQKQLTFYCDTEGLGKQLTFDLAKMYQLSVATAYPGQKDLMIEMLQDDVKNRRFKVPAVQEVGGVKVISEVEQESFKIVFERDEQDHLTRRIDDEVYHPEITRSVTYAMRYVWLKSRIKPGDVKEKK